MATKLARLGSRVRTISLATVKPTASTAQGHDAIRGSSTARGYGYAWQQARRRFLDANPLCEHCKAEGRIEAATVVDHIIPHRGNKLLFWDESNWGPLCATHHNAKTGRGE